MKVLISGGTLCTRGEASPGDLLIEDDTILSVGDGSGSAGGARVVAAPAPDPT